jgi:uracil-DNA glycosylase
MQDELFAATPGNALLHWPPEPPADPAWGAQWAAFLASPAGQGLDAFLHQRLAEGATVFPADPLRALRLTPFDAVQVLILGQDPYHGAGQAQGLAFSVAPGTPVPPSLRNILQERARDLGPSASSGPRDSLEAWAGQGVLLLNTVLTVEEGRPASHARQGWEVFTGAVVQALRERSRPMVFMAWGAHAQALCQDLPVRHLLLTANHPSPLSARRPPQPFDGCGHFGAANAWLTGLGQKPIHW